MKEKTLPLVLVALVVAVSACSQNAQQTTSTTTKSQFVTPQTVEDCTAMSGTWGKIGTRSYEQCNIHTTDAGKRCSDSDDCQGMCVNNDPLSVQGKCSDLRIVVGCQSFVENGKTQPQKCID